MSDHIVTIDYTNWRGERALRRVRPFVGSLKFGATEWHPEPQWIIDVFDVEKNERRIFAMKDIHSWVPDAAIVVFVFGSNLAGRHGKGAALHARQYHGAIYGQGEGPQGSSYGFPTKDEKLRTLPLKAIAGHVAKFIEYARANPETVFKLTAIGCGLAGYRPSDIAPMFRDAPANVLNPPEFITGASDAL